MLVWFQPFLIANGLTCLLFLILVLVVENDFPSLPHIIISLVVGCAGDSDRGKRPMMTKIATDKSDGTILTSDNPKSEDPSMDTHGSCRWIIH